MGSAGVSTAGIVFGGSNPGNTDETEIYNGTSWTEVGDMNSPRNTLASASAGTTTAALAIGGHAVTANTESFDGVAWTEENNLGTAVYAGMGAGTQDAALNAGGSRPGVRTETEEWTKAQNVKVIDD